MLTREDFIKTIVVIWVIVSVIYIGNDIWSDYKVKGLKDAYQSGLSDATKQIFEKSQSGQCKESVQLNVGENKLELIDVKCLQQQSGSSMAGQTQPESTQKQVIPQKK
jgi:hypothetical protein